MPHQYYFQRYFIRCTDFPSPAATTPGNLFIPRINPRIAMVSQTVEKTSIKTLKAQTQH